MTNKTDMTDIRSVFRSLEGQSVYFVPNPGNVGDAMIAAATFQFLKQYRITPLPVLPTTAERLDVIVYGGGGNLTPHYPEAARVLQVMHRKARRLIILPHTICGHDKLLGDFGANVEICCREPVSYAHVSKHCRNAKVSLTEDLALFLDVQAIRQQEPAPLWSVVRAAFDQARQVNGSPWRQAAPSWRSPLAASIRLAAARTLGRLQKPTLHLFRQDQESARHEIPKDNLDLADIIRFGTHCEAAAGNSTMALIAALDGCSALHTDRLHICIMGALLGKQVEFYPNNYYKCEAVYRHSLAPRFSNVIWNG